MMLKDDRMLTTLFIRLLPVQVLLVAAQALNSIVDGTVAGRCISSGTVGIFGLYYSMLCIYDAVTGVILGGTAVLCGRSMGCGDVARTSRILSLNITITTAAGAVLALLSVLMPGTIADILGASPELRGDLSEYIRWYSIGIIPLLLGKQISAFLEMERQSRRGLTGIFFMAATNCTLDVFLVYVMHMGVRGLALATATASWVYLLILIPYYFTDRAQLKYSWASIDWSDLLPMFRIGAPGALLVTCLAFRGIIINRLLLHYSGQDGLSAMSAFNLLAGLFLAYAMGVGAVVRMLSSVFMGEEDRDSIKALMRIAWKKMVPASAALTVFIILLAKPIASLFFKDTSSEVFRLAVQLFVIYALCIPAVVAIQVIVNYFQATGHNTIVNIMSVFDGIISMVIPSMILAPVMGATGVWLANPIGMALTLLLVPAYAVFRCKHFPRTSDEWLMLPDDFGVPYEDRLDITVHGLDEVVQTAERVQTFCENHGTDLRTAHFSALCMEEMSANVIKHGFNKDNKKHDVNVRAVWKSGDVMLRIKDDCVPFDPKERAEQVCGDDPVRNLGVRVVTRLADEITYQNMLGLNVLTIRLSGKKQEFTGSLLDTAE